ncbi:hypothetical protein Pcinc_004780 [Petrolisthes cinctipes]|uniref:Uncharacterized protein n=1 Tax=Petrolisthes cinctipes TaxID=88211 RepID=A0AAE1KZS8_PETCI|nr:hypothetical protein Pcinc_014173 [Petrolisthes cinctipes]KAK3891336.1 hypothetical protein Pcinc_004780 [Petrolisthes cinctipes]
MKWDVEYISWLPASAYIVLCLRHHRIQVKTKYSILYCEWNTGVWNMLVVSASGSLGSIVVPWLTEETVTLHTALLDRQQVLCSKYCRSQTKIEDMVPNISVPVKLLIILELCTWFLEH